MVRFVLSLFRVAVLASFVSAAVAVSQLQDVSVSFHIWLHLNLDINLNSDNLSLYSYLVLLLLQWYQHLTRPGVWIASPVPPATSSSHWSKSVFIFWTMWDICCLGRMSAWRSHEPLPPWRPIYLFSVGAGPYNSTEFSTERELTLSILSDLFSFINLFCEEVG